MTTLGQTNVRVTRFGMGTAPIGGWPEALASDAAVATVEAAWDAGVRFFDTAPFYSGRSLVRVEGPWPAARGRADTLVRWLEADLHRRRAVRGDRGNRR